MNKSSLDFWHAYWVSLYKMPRAWAHKGENLIYAFEAVAKASVPDKFHLDLTDQALMLAGMAIEVHIKAILVNDPQIRAVATSKKDQLNKKDQATYSVFYGHDLPSLFKLANIHLTPKRNKVAEALAQYIYWRGRYVMPVESGLPDLLPVRQVNGLRNPTAYLATIDSARDLIDFVIVEVKRCLYADS